MLNRHKVLAALGGLGLLAPLGCSFLISMSTRVEIALEQGEIRGVAIVDDNGTLESAAFSEVRLSGTGRVVRADEFGRFRFRNLVPGSYILSIAHDQNDDGWPDQHRLVPVRLSVANHSALPVGGESQLTGVSLGELQLEPATQLSGHIDLVGDEPSFGADGETPTHLGRIYAVRRAGLLDDEDLERPVLVDVEAITGVDSNGDFELSGLGGGDVALYVVVTEITGPGDPPGAVTVSPALDVAVSGGVQELDALEVDPATQTAQQMVRLPVASAVGTSGYIVLVPPGTEHPPCVADCSPTLPDGYDHVFSRCDGDLNAAFEAPVGVWDVFVCTTEGEEGAAYSRVLGPADDPASPQEWAPVVASSTSLCAGYRPATGREEETCEVGGSGCGDNEVCLPTHAAGEGIAAPVTDTVGSFGAETEGRCFVPIDDCDGDGYGFLEVPRTGSSAAVQERWDACQEACDRYGFGRRTAKRTCEYEGVLYDCDDDGDAQADTEEPAGCVGIGLGSDLDGDGDCYFVDAFPQCRKATAAECIRGTNDLPNSEDTFPVDGGGGEDRDSGPIVEPDPDGGDREDAGAPGFTSPFDETWAGEATALTANALEGIDTLEQSEIRDVTVYGGIAFAAGSFDDGGRSRAAVWAFDASGEVLGYETGELGLAAGTAAYTKVHVEGEDPNALLVVVAGFDDVGGSQATMVARALLFDTETGVFTGDGATVLPGWSTDKWSLEVDESITDPAYGTALLVASGQTYVGGVVVLPGAAQTRVFAPGASWATPPGWAATWIEGAPGGPTDNEAIRELVSGGEVGLGASVVAVGTSDMGFAGSGQATVQVINEADGAVLDTRTPAMQNSGATSAVALNGDLFVGVIEFVTGAVVGGRIWHPDLGGDQSGDEVVTVGSDVTAVLRGLVPLASGYLLAVGGVGDQLEGPRDTAAWLLGPGLEGVELVETYGNGGVVLDDDRNQPASPDDAAYSASLAFDGVSVLVGGIEFIPADPDPFRVARTWLLQDPLSQVGELPETDGGTSNPGADGGSIGEGLVCGDAICEPMDCGPDAQLCLIDQETCVCGPPACEGRATMQLAGPVTTVAELESTAAQAAALGATCIWGDVGIADDAVDGNLDIPGIEVFSGAFSLDAAAGMSILSAPALVRLDGNVEIINCSELQQVQMPTLTEISGDLSMVNNVALLQPPATTVIGDLQIVGNTQLCSDIVISAVQTLDPQPMNLEISGNGCGATKCFFGSDNPDSCGEPDPLCGGNPCSCDMFSETCIAP